MKYIRTLSFNKQCDLGSTSGPFPDDKLIAGLMAPRSWFPGPLSFRIPTPRR